MVRLRIAITSDVERTHLRKHHPQQLYTQNLVLDLEHALSPLAPSFHSVLDREKGLMMNVSKVEGWSLNFCLDECKGRLSGS